MSKEINMDIEVGDYVKTRRGIGKVLEIKTVQPKLYGKYDVAYLIDVCPRMYISESTFIKHSKNIIDLIEVGDIVNGYRIDSIDSWGVLVHEARGINKSGFSIPVAQYEEDIENVLTHEQYSQNCYTVERR